MELLLKESEFLDLILNTTEDAILVVDNNLLVQYMNNTALKMLNFEGTTYKGLHFYRELNIAEIAQGQIVPILQELLENGAGQRGIIRKTRNDRQISINAVPLIDNNIKKGLLITAKDITSYVEMEQELDMAFALTLPNSKVERKLKTLVEYQDVYDPQSKKITITGIIKDGGYRHVVNCLKLFSLLHAEGITKVIGIDKDMLVQAFVFHDLGKSQPVLTIGEMYDPKEAFEDGKQHAIRGAEIAKYHYNQHGDIVEIIRYHHTQEDELPETFPSRLLPMFRLFQLIDGLSAAITRGGVQVDFVVRDCEIQVTEENHRPHYNGTRIIDLYTGKRSFIASLKN